MYLKQNTAATIVFSGVRSAIDGTSFVESVVTGDIAAVLYKNGVRSVISRTITELADGELSIALTSDDTDTLGRLEIALLDEDVFLPVSKEFMVMPASTYESMFGSVSDRLVVPAGYVGDIELGQTLHILWGTTTDLDDAGTLRLYKDNGTGEIEVPTGITDSRDFDGLTGVHLCSIDTATLNNFYAAKADYHLVLAGASKNGVTIKAEAASFSIENRHTEIRFERDV
jgi:hypothetical protein